MSMGFSRRTHLARSIATLFLGFFALWAIAKAQPPQISGRVISRSGSPLAGCQIEFILEAAKAPSYRVTSNATGYFFLADPVKGTYTVMVRQGQDRFSISVKIDAYGLHPSSLIATW
jgi:hypothetical protein